MRVLLTESLTSCNNEYYEFQNLFPPFSSFFQSLFKNVVFLIDDIRDQFIDWKEISKLVLTYPISLS